MAEGNPTITLETLHGDLTLGFADLKGEIRAGFADLKATLVVGFGSLPSRESSEEMIRLLREGNRLQETRFMHLDVRMREQHLETQQVLHALVEGHRVLTTEVRTLTTEIKGLSTDIKGLIRRIDALIRGRSDGEPPV